MDRHNQGWHTSRDGYSADFGFRRNLSNLSYEELDATRGPLRPVVPPDPGDELVLRSALADAGVKATASLLVALYRLESKYAQVASAPGEHDGGSLVAGREGSWESARLHSLAWELGSDLDLKPKRYDEECVATVVNILEGWTSSPKRYTEVAENLAHIFSDVTDELGGWDKVADRYFQPGVRVGHPEEVIELVRTYLMSTSRLFQEEQERLYPRG